MKALMKAEFFRILKDNSFFILMGILLGMMMFSTFAQWGLTQLIANMAHIPGGMLSYSADSSLFASFTILGGGSIIVVIGIIIICTKSFSSGAIRDNIIAGYKRFQIYLSSYLVHLILFLGSVLISVLLNYFFANILFGFKIETSWDIFINYLLIGILHYIFVITLTFVLAIVFKSLAISLVTAIGLSVAFSFLALIANANFEINLVLLFLLKLIPYYQNAYISSGASSLLMGITTKLETTDIVIFIISTVFWIILSFSLGYISLRKTDLK